MSTVSSVELRKLVSHDKFDSTTIGVTVQLGPGESATDALTEAEIFVDTELATRIAGSEEYGATVSELQDIRKQLAQEKSKLEEAKKLWDQVEGILKKHGIDTERIEWHDVPF